jgi:hypothetical protein
MHCQKPALHGWSHDLQHRLLTPWSGSPGPAMPSGTGGASDTIDTLDLPFLAAVTEGLDAALRRM